MRLKMLMKDVPLFPLGVVLFPEMNLPLRIFEPRYRQMIADCIDSGLPFGVVLIKEGDEVKQEVNQRANVTLHPVGTLAKISQVVKLDDGTLLITTIGTERFQLKSYHEGKPYLSGDIETYPDGAISGDSPEVQRLVFDITNSFEKYFEVLQELANRRIEKVEIPANPVTLSYFIPHWLRISLEEKQALLELPAPRERLLEEHILLIRETESLNKLKETILQELEEAEGKENQNRNLDINNIASRFSRN
jgi:uncharacterized protein